MNFAGRRTNDSSLFKPRTRTDDDAVLSESVIISARKTGQLNLSLKGLSSVPERVWAINELTSEELREIDMALDFDGEKERWWEYEQLKILNLSSNSLTKLDSRVQFLSELNSLDLHDNIVDVVPPEIGTLSKLRTLNLASNKLRILPSKMYELCELRSLDVSNNLIENLEPAVGDLVMLEKLVHDYYNKIIMYNLVRVKNSVELLLFLLTIFTQNLSCNNLTTLPVGMGYLVRLVSIDLSHNMLKELPPDITSMRALKKLDASFNQLEDLPPMGELRRMEVLALHNNNLTTPPDTIGCTALCELHLSNNKIKEIDVSSLESMTHLKTLTLANNKIEIIPEEIVQLCSLERLDLTNNNITYIPNCVSFMPNLQTFLVDGNNVGNVRRDIIQCGTSRILRYLRESMNVEDIQAQMTFLPFTNKQIPGLFLDNYALRNGKLLSLANQNLTEIPDSISKEAFEAEATSIDLSKNQLRELPDHLSIVSTVKELKLARNRFDCLPEWIGEKYEHLQFVDVANNQLSTLPGSIVTLIYLREINLAYNRFSEIPECIYDLPGLEILIANNNQIEKIDVTSLNKLRRLANLDLSNNNIIFVPPELGNLRQLKFLALSGNCFKQPRHTTLSKSTDEVLAYLRDRIST